MKKSKGLDIGPGEVILALIIIFVIGKYLGWW
jgi:hypothetical protein